MKKLAIVISLSFLIPLNGQDLNEDFLKSLPEGMQADIQKRIDGEGKTEEPVYRSIESQTELEKKSLEDLKNRLELDLAFLKNKLEEDIGNTKKRDMLDLFGSSFFSTYQSTYMPINEPNLSPEYVLDFGDVLNIQLIGQEDYDEKVSIGRDGSVNLPKIGKLTLSGLSLGEASAFLKSKVKSSFIGTEAYVSLNSIRDINVLVSGNAFNPGIYTVSGNSNMLHVLGVAGGINEYGSYREINLIRNQKVIETLDMYDVLITGSYNSKVTLKSGDVIFVKPVKNLVSIDGAVKVPARYELKEGQNLSDLIQYANGTSADADMSSIFLNRILDGKVKSLPISNIKQFNTLKGNDGDKVYIRKHSLRAVNIEGAVMKPGRYLMAEGESIFDLIEKSGGYTENAYPFGAVYENKSALVINKMAKEKLYTEFIDNIITMSQKNPTGGVGLSSIIELTDKLNNTQPNGRIVIDLIDDDYNSLVIREGDKLTIPERPGHVYIYGEVSYEGALKYDSNGTLENYISKSGGLKANANEKAIYVLHPNGDTQRASIKKSLFQNSPDNELILYPGSVIFVPRRIDDSAGNRLAAQAYVSILGNLGIALASLSSINNN